jgi:hypothetical protein
MLAEVLISQALSRICRESILFMWIVETFTQWLWLMMENCFHEEGEEAISIKASAAMDILMILMSQLLSKLLLIKKSLKSLVEGITLWL